MDDDNSNGNDNDSIDTTFNDSNEDPTLRKFIACHRNISLQNYTDKVRRYLEFECKVPGDGIKRIVSCAFAMNTNNDSLQLSLNKIEFHIKATKFCWALPSSLQSTFGELCNMMLNDCMLDPNNNSSIPGSRLPTSLKDIDRYYVKRSTSIAQNIPIPSILELDYHTCVSLIEIVQHLLYFSVPIDALLIDKCDNDYQNIITSSSHLNCALISDHIRKEVKNDLSSSSVSPLIIPITVWSDDFEPNHVKQHKKSTWIKTVTLSPPYDCQVSFKHAYVVALGPKDKNHEKYIILFLIN